MNTGLLCLEASPETLVITAAGGREAIRARALQRARACRVSFCDAPSSRARGVCEASRDPRPLSGHKERRFGDHVCDVEGRDRFKGEEITWIREQLKQLRVCERAEQKRIRAALRRAEFRISDWAADAVGFTVSDFDRLLAGGRIVRDDGAGLLALGPDLADWDIPGAAIEMWVERERQGALEALTAPRHTIAAAFAGAVPDEPGLYAIYGARPAWRQLCLGEPPDDRPLYVGKAEDSLVSRDLNTHFATGTTGRSSPRRSFAALLAGQLALVAMPRRPADPEPARWTHYGLEPEGDDRLTSWMRERLRLAVWPRSHAPSLGGIEAAVMAHWRPPLNLTGVSQPWRAQVRRAREAMAGAAKEWAEVHGFGVEAG